MRTTGDVDGPSTNAPFQTPVLGSQEEREALLGLAECKRTLAEALAAIPGVEPPRGGDDPHSWALSIASHYTCRVETEAWLGAVYLRYQELRTHLALANMRLVAHVAKRFRDRGIAYSDLLQEGFCGLLEAIDRFDPAYPTKLATYATWWIRQSMQRAVASGAYPVRLSPRHLRQLAQNQGELIRRNAPHDDEEIGRSAGASAASPYKGDARDEASHVSDLVRRIHAATRPTVSLDATSDAHSNFTLIQAISAPEEDPGRGEDLDRAVGKLMEDLRPREREVLALRFGLGGRARLSLSQAGKALSISKERVRQIQDRALEKLRASAEQCGLAEALIVDL